jgi:hypothetical protein
VKLPVAQLYKNFQTFFWKPKVRRRVHKSPQTLDTTGPNSKLETAGRSVFQLHNNGI